MFILKNKFRIAKLSFKKLFALETEKNLWNKVCQSYWPVLVINDKNFFMENKLHIYKNIDALS